MMLPKPTKGTRKADQHRRTAARRLDRLAAKPRRWLKRSAPPAKVGAVGKRQARFNAHARRAWRYMLGHEPWAVVAAPGEMGGPGVPFVVGHILARKPHPELRADPLNVCPITSEANRLMSEPGPFCAFAQERMRSWIRENEARILAAFAATEAAR